MRPAPVEIKRTLPEGHRIFDPRRIIGAGSMRVSRLKRSARGSMHQRMVMLGAVLVCATACTRDEPPASDTARLRSATQIAASPPLAGFTADVPAGRIPGVIPATRGRSAESLGLVSAADTAKANGTTPAATSNGPAPAATSGTARDSSAPPPMSRPGEPAKLAEGEISAASGVFTTEQAERGRAVYTSSCAACHMSTQHSGGTFANTWHNRRVSDLYELLYSTMPLDAPGSLSAQQYIDVVAYMLQLNGHPAGTSTLPQDLPALRKVRIDIRSTAGLQ